jgi:hypothetical protein
MEPVVGIFAFRTAAERAVRVLKSRGFPPDRVQLLIPERAEEELKEIPIDDAEQPGVGRAVGAVVGGAAGATAGLGVGAIAASLLLPGIGPVTAIGLAAAALFGAGGAAAGASAGEALEEKTTHGLPRDEIYLYEDALSHGHTIVFAIPETEAEEQAARAVMEREGAESLDAARERWWIGLRDVEREHYDDPNHDFESAEPAYRRGFAAALHPDFRDRPWPEARRALRAREGNLADLEPFRRGYERGREHGGRRPG